MTFDLPAQKEAFLAETSWDFTVVHAGHEIEVSLRETDGRSEEAELALFKRTALGVLEQKEAAVRLAADRFFAAFLAKWNRGDSISREEFEARLIPSAIAIDCDGRATLEFTDEHDMFWGHAVVVSFDPTAKIVDAELAG